jgi:hypothetical protein
MEKDKDLPSFIKSWNHFYFIVIAWLVVLIMVFYLITRAFS